MENRFLRNYSFENKTFIIVALYLHILIILNYLKIKYIHIKIEIFQFFLKKYYKIFCKLEINHYVYCSF